LQAISYYIMDRTDPIISVQISVYALDGNVREAGYTYLDTLNAAAAYNVMRQHVHRYLGRSLSLVWPALQSAYQAVASQHRVIVNTVLCNAAPLPAKASGQR